MNDTKIREEIIKLFDMNKKYRAIQISKEKEILESMGIKQKPKKGLNVKRDDVG